MVMMGHIRPRCPDCTNEYNRNKTMKLKNIIQSGCLAIVVAASSTSFAQSSISTYGSWNGTDGVYYAISDSYVFGQTFKVGADNVLNDFTVWTKQYNNAGSGSAIAKIYQWDETNDTVVGSSLFTSGSYSVGANTSYTATTVTTSNLSLVTGTDYILFFEADAQSAGTLWGLINGDALIDSKFTYQDNPQTIFDPWVELGTVDLAFTANFTSSNPGNNAVPEPSEWAAMGLLGTGLLGLVVRGRKRLAN